MTAFNRPGVRSPSFLAGGGGGASPTEPGVPQNIAFGTVDSFSIEVTWSAPASDGGASITGYEVAGRKQSDSSSIGTKSGSSPQTFTSLTRATYYEFRVRAQNSVGWGAWSDWTAQATDAVAPGAPTSLTSGTIGTDSIQMTWAEPTDTGGATITGYEIAGRKKSDATSIGTKSGFSPKTFSGLTASTDYEFQARAQNEAGWGPWTSWVTKSTSASATAPGVPQNVRGGTIIDTTLMVLWDAPSSDGGAEITGYEVAGRKKSDASSIGTKSGFSPQTFTGLTASTEYEFQVRAQNSVGWSSWTSWVTLSTVAKPANYKIAGEFVGFLPDRDEGSTGDWFVSPTGDDSNAGTVGAPFKTIAKAMTSASAGDVIRLRAGREWG